jgi:hypothetical protein
MGTARAAAIIITLTLVASSSAAKDCLFDLEAEESSPRLLTR